ncbi:hypothetical protein [Amycolatopsis sp. NPDC004378]
MTKNSAFAKLSTVSLLATAAFTALVLAGAAERGPATTSPQVSPVGWTCSAGHCSLPTTRTR